MFIWTFLLTIKFQTSFFYFQKLHKIIQTVMKQNTKSPWESCFWKLKIRHTRPTTSENDKRCRCYFASVSKVLKNQLVVLSKTWMRNNTFLHTLLSMTNFGVLKHIEKPLGKQENDLFVIDIGKVLKILSKCSKFWKPWENPLFQHLFNLKAGAGWPGWPIWPVWPGWPGWPGWPAGSDWPGRPAYRLARRAAGCPTTQVPSW